MSANIPQDIGELSILNAQNGLVILEPEKWIGKAFPLAEYLDSSHDVSIGDWIILLYHHDCPKCLEALSEYQNLSVVFQKTNILLIEFPPFGDKRLEGNKNIYCSRLSDKMEWFAQMPIEIQLSSGKVKAVSLDLPSIANR